MHYKEIFDIEFNEIYMLSYMWIYLKKNQTGETFNGFLKHNLC